MTKWTKEEIQYLLENKDKKSYKEIAKDLGRTYSSVNQKCLYLSRPRKKFEADRQKLYFEPLTKEEIKDYMDRANIGWNELEALTGTPKNYLIRAVHFDEGPANLSLKVLVSIILEDFAY